MTTRNRIPTALEPYLQLPPELSLTILTGTLGCSPSWLVTRFVGALLGSSSTPNDSESAGPPCRVVLASWMRDLAFWKNELRRSIGIDISKVIKNARFAFIDCLLNQTLSEGDDPTTKIESIISTAIEDLSNPDEKVVLVLDSPDVLLATGSATAQQINFLMLKVRSKVHSVILTCSADQPFLNAAALSTDMKATPLEMESASFLTQQAHNARLVLSVRELATGAAKDISGELRVTRSACAYDGAESASTKIEEMEALYLVQRDGNVKVFQRGADAI